MKKILFFALVAMMCVQGVDAQRSERPRRDPKQIVENLDKKLNLSDEQEKQIEELYKAFFEKKVSREDRKAQMDELNSKISSLLNEDQKKEFEKIKNAPRKDRARK